MSRKGDIMFGRILMLMWSLVGPSSRTRSTRGPPRPARARREFQALPAMLRRRPGSREKAAKISVALKCQGLTMKVTIIHGAMVNNVHYST